MTTATAAYAAYAALEQQDAAQFDLADLTTVGTLRPMTPLERAGQLIAAHGHAKAMHQLLLKADDVGLTDFDRQVALAIGEDARR